MISRFRANFVVEGFSAMDERIWKRLRIGDHWFTVSVMYKTPHSSPSFPLVNSDTDSGFQFTSSAFAFSCQDFQSLFEYKH